VIESGYNGILVEPGNVEETAKAIIELATNKSVRHEMGANAEIRLRKFFSSQDSLEKLSKLIKSDLNRWKKD
ncbi:MAG: hypothetical protein K2L37_00405, partial [Lactobacillus sp.]|nr:hypothetical protein [Lactobacillus sp.]